MSGDYLQELAGELYSLRNRAVTVRPLTRKVAGFKPLAHECHANAEAWVALHPHSQIVRGWLLYDYQLSAFPMVRFQAHSVVEDSDGRLFDVTPREGSGSLPFLRHPDGNEMFDLIVSRHEIVSISHRLR